MTEKLKKRRKTRVGRVVSNKPNKTVVVQVDRVVFHPMYKKRVKRSRKVYAHDQDNKCRIGDVVKVTESRPLSRLKRWRVSGILERAE